MLLAPVLNDPNTDDVAAPGRVSLWLLHALDVACWTVAPIYGVLGAGLWLTRHPATETECGLGFMALLLLLVALFPVAIASTVLDFRVMRARARHQERVAMAHSIRIALYFIGTAGVVGVFLSLIRT